MRILGNVLTFMISLAVGFALVTLASSYVLNQLNPATPNTTSATTAVYQVKNTVVTVNGDDVTVKTVASN